MLVTLGRGAVAGLASLTGLSLLRSTLCPRSLPFSVMAQADPNTASSIHEFTARTIDGDEISLSKYKGRVAVVVNVASK